MLQLSQKTVASALKVARTFVSGLERRKIKVCMAGYGKDENDMRTLKHLGAQMVKISPDVASEALKSDTAKTRLKELLSELHNQNLVTIVPNVTNPMAMAMLWQMGASMIQGDYLQGPSAEMSYEFTPLV